MPAPAIQIGVPPPYLRTHGAKISRRHMYDWIVLVLLAAIEIVLNVISPFHRFVAEFMMDDLRYPMNTIPVWAVPIYAVVVPMLIFAAIYVMKKNAYDLHHAILGLLFSVLITGVLTDAIKDGVGRPRPNFYYRCFPDGVPKYEEFTRQVICHGDARVIKEGHKSFPSGHTSSNAVSRDHKPDQIDERQRIEDAGGFVMWAGTWRVGRVLAVSRGFGDKILKQKDIFMLSRARNGGSSSEGIRFTLSGGNNHYRETDSAYNDMPEVILDNQAQVNCTGNFNVLSNLSIGPANVVLIAANGGEMETFMSGSVHMGNFILPDVHYCPDLGNRVIVSGSILDNDDYGYEFGRGKFTVKDLKNDTTVGEGRLVDGNYILEYLKISGDRTRVPQQPGLVTTVWNAICSALHRVGLNPQGPPM